jgi:hypothetical protein
MLSPRPRRALGPAAPHIAQKERQQESIMDEATASTATKPLKLFVPIIKIDAAKRLVYGVVTAEAPDALGEVCDYASTKPHYQKWSQKFATATDGKSFGNLRAMHGVVAAGKLVDIAYNDDARRIEICGKVVDDAEWQKVEEGVYTGFSQGGRYVRRWTDPDDPKLMRYTAEPTEVSLVDHPCLPDATFAVIKADGSMEARRFKGAAAASGGAAAAEKFAKIGARHSKADKERIKQSHDLLVALDPDCCPGAHIPGANVEPRPKFSPQAGEGAGAAGDEAEGPETEKFNKLVDRRVDVSVEKGLHSMNARLDEMLARLKKVEDQPMPLGTSSVRVVDKSEDALIPEAKNLLDRPGGLEALAEMAIRRAQQAPMHTIPGTKPRQR